MLWWVMEMKESELGGVLTYIDANIEEQLTVAKIASYAGYSAYYFSRMFSARMRVSVMEYVRARKLQHAIVQLLAGERVIDIAVRYGFESHEGFTRAFQRAYRITPSGFRARHTGPYAVRLPSIPKQEKDVKPMKARFEQWPEKKLIGYLLHTSPGSEEIPAFWAAVMGDARWARLVAKANGLNYGICIHPEGMPEDRMDYLLAFDYDGVSAPDVDMTLFDLPAATYAAFDTRQTDQPFVEGIRDTWQFIYEKWFDASGYVYDGFKPDFELYRGPSACEVYIPVRKKSS